MTRLIKRIAVGSVVASLAALAACGSGSSSTTSSGGGASAAGVVAAQKVVDANTKTPTDLGLTNPLKAPPKTGLKVISLTVPAPVNAVKNEGAKAAAEALGWNFSIVDAGATSASAVTGFESAIAKKPDAIIFTAYPAVVFKKQIAEAKAAGITVMSDSTADGDTSGVIANLDSSAQFREWGVLSGAYAVADSKGKAKVALFTLGEYPIFTPFVDGFKQTVAKYCSDCTVEVVNQQVSDLGAKLPTNVVSYLQRKPNTNWVAFPSGDQAQGVAAAIKAAGISGVKIGGDGASLTNLQNLANGTEQMWVGFPGVVLGWREIDLLARHFEGSSIEQAKSALLPAQIITKGTVGSIAKTSDGFYVGVSDYATQFKKLWKVQ